MTNETLTLRRKTAIEQLEKQLKSGTKPNRGKNKPEGTTATAFKKQVPRIPLTSKDIKRIKSTIAILKQKLAQQWVQK
jgi:hypothetical protein